MRSRGLGFAFVFVRYLFLFFISTHSITSRNEKTYVSQRPQPYSLYY
jgi:hypothetical protein